jgi:hypothetical protein
MGGYLRNYFIFDVFFLLWDDDRLNNQNGNQDEKRANKVGFHHSITFFGILNQLKIGFILRHDYFFKINNLICD